MLETAAVPALRVLKRADVPGPFLATASFAYGGYSRLFAAEPEEQANPGFFTDGIYAASPVLLDSGGAALLASGSASTGGTAANLPGERSLPMMRRGCCWA